jgi:hypothetical protein
MIRACKLADLLFVRERLSAKESMPLVRRWDFRKPRWPRNWASTRLAKILNVSVEHLFGTATPKARGTGPAGKLRQVFEKASQLPRHQQNKVAEFVDAFVKQHTSQEHA